MGQYLEWAGAVPRKGVGRDRAMGVPGTLMGCSLGGTWADA